MSKREKISSDTKAEVWDKTGGRCWYCGMQCNPFKTREYCIDHVIPFSKGGSDDVGNLVPCCISCNSQKRAKDIEQYREFFTKRVRFTDEQKKLIIDSFGNLPRIPKHIFWFEKEGMNDESTF